MTTFTPGSKWRIVKDLKDFPTHAEGGVDLVVNPKGVFFSTNDFAIVAQDGALISDQDIKAPVDYLNSYFQSPEFQKRAGKNFPEEQNWYNYEAPRYNPTISNDTVTTTNTRTGNINYSPAEASQAGYDIATEAVPHEYSHLVRTLTPEESMKIARANNDPNAAKMFRTFLKNTPETNMLYDDYTRAYTQMLRDKNVDEHNIAPHENYADLNALRFMLYHKGYYDTRKGDLDIGTLNKALQDPDIKNSFLIQRLLKNFTPEKLVMLNNSIALNQPQQPQATAQDGMVIPAPADTTVPYVKAPMIGDSRRYTRYVDSIHNANMQKNFVQRYVYPDNYPRMQTNTLPGNDENGKPYSSYPDDEYSTHLMSYDPGSKRVYPLIVQQPDGSLKYLGPGDPAYDYADSTGEYITFPTAEAAKKFADNGYKRGNQYKKK